MTCRDPITAQRGSTMTRSGPSRRCRLLALLAVLCGALAPRAAAFGRGAAAGAAGARALKAQPQPQLCTSERAVKALKELVVARHQGNVVFGTVYGNSDVGSLGADQARTPAAGARASASAPPAS